MTKFRKDDIIKADLGKGFRIGENKLYKICNIVPHYRKSNGDDYDLDFYTLMEVTENLREIKPHFDIDTSFVDDSAEKDIILTMRYKREIGQSSKDMLLEACSGNGKFVAIYMKAAGKK